jgi:hypothetical protein
VLGFVGKSCNCKQQEQVRNVSGGEWRRNEKKKVVGAVPRRSKSWRVSPLERWQGKQGSQMSKSWSRKCLAEEQLEQSVEALKGGQGK